MAEPDFRVAIVPVTVLQQNCALLWDVATRRAVVIDPGGDPVRIMDGIERYGLRVEAMWLTHGHLDHAGGAMELKSMLDAQAAPAGHPPVPLVGPDRRDRFLLDSIEEVAAGFGVEGLHNATPDRWLAEGDVLTLGPMRLDVLHVPGHTPGSLVFVEKDRRFAVLGDVLFKGSIGRTDFAYGNGPELVQGIRTKLLPLGDDVRFICGHGEGSTLGAERTGNPFLQD